MSICSSGLSSPGPLQLVTIAVAPTHPLIQLAQVTPWQALAQLDSQPGASFTPSANPMASKACCCRTVRRACILAS